MPAELPCSAAGKRNPWLRVDYVCFALIVLGFGVLQITLDRYERDDGFSSYFITGLGLAAMAGLTTLVVWELLHPQPVMNIRLLRSRAFASLV